jgi:polysaccharide deacetylase 2 family uncharacterized protein YibQ
VVKGLVSGIATGVLVMVAVGFLLSMATPVPRRDRPEIAVVPSQDTGAEVAEVVVPTGGADASQPTGQSEAVQDTPQDAVTQDEGAQGAAQTTAPPDATEPPADAATPPAAEVETEPAADAETADSAPPPTKARRAGDTPTAPSGLGSPLGDQPPGNSISTSPGTQPDAAAIAAQPAPPGPRPDTAPRIGPADGGTTERIAALRRVGRPAGPLPPRIEAAPDSPGLPGRAVQSTGVDLGQPGPDTEAALRLPSTAPSAVPDLRAPAPPAPEGRSALPQTGGGQGPGADTGTQGPRDSAAPDAAPEAAPDASPVAGLPPTPQPGEAALPRVNRPVGDGGGLPGDPGRRAATPGFSPEVAVNGPAAPAPPRFEDRALPLPGGQIGALPGTPAGQGQRRLPQIGDDIAAAPEPDATADPGSDIGAPAGQGAAPTPLDRNAEPFENPQARPLFAVILRDIGAAGIGRDRLAALDLPVTIAIDPTTPDAGAAAATYRAAGKEVVVIAADLPDGATPTDIEVNLEGMFATVPQAVALINPPSGGFQGDRVRARQIVQILGGLGYGLVTHDRGLNAAAQIAQRDGVPDARVFRVLDGEGETGPLIRRYLDRAAFRAAQQGWAAVMGDSRPETVAALLGWALEGRGATLAFAPVSAVLDRR